MLENIVEAIQNFWAEAFDDDWVPSEHATTILMERAGDFLKAMEAISICSEAPKMVGKPFEVRFSYTLGIARNLNNCDYKIKKPRQRKNPSANEENETKQG